MLGAEYDDSSASSFSQARRDSTDRIYFLLTAPIVRVLGMYCKNLYKVFKSRANQSFDGPLQVSRVAEDPHDGLVGQKPFREESADGENEGFDHVFHSAVFRRERQSH